MSAVHISTYHGEPDHWSGAHGTKPVPAPVYGRALDRLGNPLALDIDVLVFVGHGLPPRRGKVVGIGDPGLPDNPTAKVRQHGSAHLFSASCNGCEPHSFDEYQWLKAEEEAATTMTTRGVDLTRCQFGGFYFDEFQRMAMKHYLARATPSQSEQMGEGM